MSRIITVGTHNMTEGELTAADVACTILALQEISRRKIAGRLRRPYWGRLLPIQDPHQGIGWRREEFEAVGPPRVVRLHRSGKAEKWDGIATPARFILIRTLRHRETGVVISVFSVWLINSWSPATKAGYDKFTSKRHDIAIKSLKVLRQLIAEERTQGREIIVMGDFNSLRAQISLPGMKEAFDRGLDRIFYSDGLELLRTWEGPKTGEGPDMQHNSRHARFKIVADTREG